MTDVLRWPFGSAEEDAVAITSLPGHWQTTNFYGARYEIQPGIWNYHTGIDVVLHYPTFGSEINRPLYAIADGTVIYSGIGTGTWGWIVVVEHVHSDGSKFYSRTAHGNHKTYTPVKTGDTVVQGQELIPLGNADGTFPYHVHFDISTTSAMKNNPSDWPGINLARVLADYVDPIKFIEDSKQGVVMPPVVNLPTFKVTVATAVLNVRKGPDTTYPVVRTLKSGDVVTVIGYQGLWYQIGVSEYIASWLTTPVVVPVPPAPIVTDTVIDLFHGNTIINPATLKTAIAAKAITAIMHKATEGTTFVDPQFSPRRAEYGPLVTFGATHMLSADDPIAQAEFFLTTVNPQGTTPLAVDVEANGTPAQAAIFAAHVTARTGKPCMLYTRAGYWGDAPATDGPLWISSQQTPPLLPSKYATWVLQQHSQTTVSGIDGLVDRDQFNGDAAALSAFWPTVSGTLIVAPATVTMYVTEDGLRVRSGPGTAFPILYYFKKDDPVTVETTLYDGSNLKWRKIVGKAEYLANDYLSATQSPVTQPAPAVSPVSARPGMHLQGSGINHDWANTIVAAVKDCKDSGHPMGPIVVCDDPGLANNLALFAPVVYRHVALGDQFDLGKCNTPENARAHAQFIYNIHKADMAAAPNVQYFQLKNERDANVDFELETMRLAGLDGRKIGILAYSVGRPTTIDEYKTMEPALRYAMAHGHVAILHEYGEFVNGQVSNQFVSNPHAFEWYGGRHRMDYAAVAADCRPKLIIGETGPSNSIYNSAEDLVADQRAYLALLRADPYVIGQCPFTFGPSWQNGRWCLDNKFSKYVAFVKSV